MGMKNYIACMTISILLIISISILSSAMTAERIKKSTSNLADSFLPDENDSSQDIKKLADGNTISDLESQITSLESTNKTQEDQLSTLISNDSTRTTNISSLISTDATQTNNLSSLQSSASNLTTDDTNKTTQLNNLSSTETNLQNSINWYTSNNTTASDFLKAHPIWTLYITHNGTNPGSIYGGSWYLYAQDRTLIGAGSTGDSNGTWWGFSGGQTGGESSHQLSSSEMASHNHQSAAGLSSNGLILNWDGNLSGYYWGYPGFTGQYTSSGAYDLRDSYTSYTGGNGYHNNMQPYVAVYMWLRNG